MKTGHSFGGRQIQKRDIVQLHARTLKLCFILSWTLSPCSTRKNALQLSLLHSNDTILTTYDGSLSEYKKQASVMTCPTLKCEKGPMTYKRQISWQILISISVKILKNKIWKVNWKVFCDSTLGRSIRLPFPAFFQSFPREFNRPPSPACCGLSKWVLFRIPWNWEIGPLA